MKVVDDERLSIADGMAARIKGLRDDAARAKETARIYQRTVKHDDEARRQQAQGMLIAAGQLECAAKLLEEFEPRVRSGRERLYQSEYRVAAEMRVGFPVPEELWERVAKALGRFLCAELEADGKKVDLEILIDACDGALLEFVGDAAFHALQWAEYAEELRDREPDVTGFEVLWKEARPWILHEYAWRIKAKKKAASEGSGSMENIDTASIARVAAGGQGVTGS